MKTARLLILCVVLALVATYQVPAVYASSGTSWMDIIYNFTSPTTSSWTLPYVPPVFPPAPKPKIDIEKYTNNMDADSAPGPSIIVGQSVTWKYVITNTGNYDLKNIVVTDDKVGLIGTITSLAVGKSQTFYAYGTAQADQYENTAYVEGWYISCDICGDSVNIKVCDSDKSHYYGIILLPGVDLEKYVNGDDADDQPGPEVVVGSDVTFDFEVTNIGEVDLTNLLIEDDVFGEIGTIALLHPGQSVTFTKLVKAAEGQHTNTAWVTCDQPVDDEDYGNYFGNIPTTKQGRWTGGGTIGRGATVPRGTRVTHGFELHNDLDKPNNLEINWGGNKFHLTELLSADCFWNDDVPPPNPPKAPVNEIIGFGTGSYNGKTGYFVEFDFTDAGEPGTKDYAYIKITAPNQAVVLLVEGYLIKGNHQAHEDNQ